MFARSRVAAGLTVACSLVLAAQRVAIGANEVVVKNGTLVFEQGKGHLDISGTESFALTADVALTGGVFSGYSTCEANQCVPGQTVDLHATWFGLDMQGDARLRGRRTATWATSTVRAARISTSQAPRRCRP